MGEFQVLREELASCRNQLAAAIDTAERQSRTAVAEKMNRPDAPQESSLIDTLRQELRTVREDAERAGVANSLLHEKEAEMRLDGRNTHSMVQEVKKQHDKVTAKVDHLVLQDLQDLTNKEVKKYIMDVKAENEELSNKVKQVEELLNKAKHLALGAVNPSPNIVANGSVSGGHT